MKPTSIIYSMGGGGGGGGGVRGGGGQEQFCVRPGDPWYRNVILLSPLIPIPQVQRMHFGFQTMSSGVRTPSNSSLNGVSASIAPVHYRCDSAPLEAYPGASSRSPTYYGRKGSFGRVYSPPLLDPLAEYTASQLAGNPENYRMSVAW